MVQWSKILQDRWANPMSAQKIAQAFEVKKALCAAASESSGLLPVPRMHSKAIHKAHSREFEVLDTRLFL